MGRRLIVFAILTILFAFQYDVLAKRLPLRIINGTNAEEGEFPYAVQLLESSGHFVCGGSILGPEWILTAGHCVEDGRIDSIIYGTNEKHSQDGYNNTSILVKNWFQHTKYFVTSDHMPLYDVGILQLAKPIPLCDTAQLIKLPEADQEVPFHVQGILSGWGVNETMGSSPPYLQKITLQLLTDNECTQIINGHSGKNTFQSIHNICSDDYYNGECFGDSGGPYVINGTQYGIVSWSYKPCGMLPGAYSRITNPEYRNWVKNVTNI